MLITMKKMYSYFFEKSSVNEKKAIEKCKICDKLSNLSIRQ